MRLNFAASPCISIPWAHSPELGCAARVDRMSCQSLFPQTPPVRSIPPISLVVLLAAASSTLRAARQKVVHYPHSCRRMSRMRAALLSRGVFWRSVDVHHAGQTATASLRPKRRRSRVPPITRWN